MGHTSTLLSLHYNYYEVWDKLPRPDECICYNWEPKHLYRRREKPNGFRGEDSGGHDGRERGYDYQQQIFFITSVQRKGDSFSKPAELWYQHETVLATICQPISQPIYQSIVQVEKIMTEPCNINANF